MKISTLIAPLLPLVVAAFPAFAQDGTLTPGLDAAPQADDGIYVKSVEGDWQIQCLRPQTEAEPERCQLYQLLETPDGTPLAEVSVQKLEGAGLAVASGVLVVPLETSLTRRISIQVDAGTAKAYEYSFCSQIGCFARVGFTEADIDEFRRGRAASVTFFAADRPNNPLTLTMSLSGFTAAFNGVDPLQP